MWREAASLKPGTAAGSGLGSEAGGADPRATPQPRAWPVLQYSAPIPCPPRGSQGSLKTGLRISEPGDQAALQQCACTCVLYAGMCVCRVCMGVVVVAGWSCWRRQKLGKRPGDRCAGRTAKSLPDWQLARVPGRTEWPGPSLRRSLKALRHSPQQPHTRGQSWQETNHRFPFVASMIIPRGSRLQPQAGAGGREGLLPGVREAPCNRRLVQRS